MKNVDIRQFQFHEVTSPKFRLRAPTECEGSLADRTLNFWGTCDEALTLEGRSLFLQKEGGEPLQVIVTSGTDQFEAALAERDRVHPWLWPIALDKELDAFSASDFDEEEPLVTVYGNLVDATEGKTETEAVLGNGDNRESFQTFKIPKPPLTYLRSEEDNPPYAPQLEIYVDDRRWQRFASFFGHGPLEEIYIVREDADGNSWVQFGDGTTGARLPSGYQNVVAVYRSGAGAYGPIKEGATAQAGARLNHLKKVQMPGIATGGELPEEAETAREAAPGKARGLGRLVGLDDYESEALAAPGVVKAVARWGLHANVPAVLITALMEQGREAEFAELRDILTAADRSRGARRFPIITNPGIRQYVYLGLTFGYNPAFRKAQVLQAVKEALGLSGVEDEGIDGSNGLFSLRQRTFGQPEYATRIVGVVQNVDGVLWARVDNFGPLVGFYTSDPAKIIVPKLPIRNDVVLCHPLLANWADQLLLCLHATHFAPVPLAADSTEVHAHD